MSRATTSTAWPASRSRTAQDSPITPAPTTITLLMAGSVLGEAQIREEHRAAGTDRLLANKQDHVDLRAVPSQRRYDNGRVDKGPAADQQVHREAGDVSLPVAFGDDRDDALPDELPCVVVPQHHGGRPAHRE